MLLSRSGWMVLPFLFKLMAGSIESQALKTGGAHVELEHCRPLDSWGSDTGSLQKHGVCQLQLDCLVDNLSPSRVDSGLAIHAFI